MYLDLTFLRVSAGILALNLLRIHYYSNRLCTGVVISLIKPFQNHWWQCLCLPSAPFLLPYRMCIPVSLMAVTVIPFSRTCPTPYSSFHISVSSLYQCCVWTTSWSHWNVKLHQRAPACLAIHNRLHSTKVPFTLHYSTWRSAHIGSLDTRILHSPTKFSACGAPKI